MATLIEKAKTMNKVASSLEALNQFFKDLSFQERLVALYDLFDVDEVLMTSSFGTSSAFLLYFIKQAQPAQKIHFINTGYHFPETLAYKEELENWLNLELIELKPDPEKHNRTRKQETWSTDMDQCCLVNKLEPMNAVKSAHKVWISGVMGFQTPHRAGLEIFEKKGDIIKFHPLIDIEEGDFLYYKSYFKLPEHPLAIFGYGSVGCMHCTVKGEGRSGRWQGQQKTECGLHTDYFNKAKK